MLATIMALLGAGGGVAYSAASSRKQFERQMRLQQQAQNWTEYMSNTAHQREVADLRRAGMNPILTATGGNGASWSSPSSGHADQAQSVDFSKVADAVNQAASVDVAEQNADTQAAAQKSQADVNKSIVQLNQANTALAQAKAAKEGMATPLYKEGTNVLNKGIESVKTLFDKNTWKGMLGSSGKVNSANKVSKSPGFNKKSDGHVPGFKNYPGRDKSDFPLKVQVYGNPFYKGFNR